MGRRAQSAVESERSQRHTTTFRVGRGQETGVSPSDLGVASDIFALGLIYAEYLTGAVPLFDAPRFHEPAVAVRSGETLHVARTVLRPELADLIAMLLADPPGDRPTARFTAN